MISRAILVFLVSLLIAQCLAVDPNREFKEKGSSGFAKWVEDVIEEQAALIARTRRNIASGIKSYVIVEPTERETNSADDAMNYLFNFGTDKLVDTIDKMDYFCREKRNFLVEVSAWVIRKYTFHLDIRVVMSLILSRMLKKNDLYCADQNFKQNFVKFTELITPINPVLNTIRNRFVDSLVAIQKSNIGITKMGPLCCGYWNYRKDTLNAINQNYPELRAFVADMMDSYFGGGLKYLCLAYQENSFTCSTYKSSPLAQVRDRDSMLMNLIDAAAKVSDIIL